MKPNYFKYDRGDFLKKKKGSQWHGRVVGFYITGQTREGYALESIYEQDSVQIYPVEALEPFVPEEEVSEDSPLIAKLKEIAREGKK